MMMRRFALFVLIAFAVATAVAQQGPSAAQQQSRAIVLRPPQGARVAIVEFVDLQCPDCARAMPLLNEAAKKYNIPLVRYDFPLPRHDWAFDAAVIARYLDTRSKKLGDDFRDWIMRNQTAITAANLRAKADEFARQNGTALPFILDAKGELAKLVQADFRLGQKIGIQHTPTIFVVNNSSTGQPFVEVVDRRELFNLIEQMERTAAPLGKSGARGSKPAKKRTGSPRKP